MLVFCLSVFICFAFLAVYGVTFNRSEYWKEMLNNYPCDKTEYKIQKPLKVGNRFIICHRGDWQGTNAITTKIANDSVYFGSGFPMGLIIRPIKIPQSALVFDSIQRVPFQKRAVYKVKNIDPDLIKISLRLGTLE